MKFGLACGVLVIFYYGSKIGFVCLKVIEYIHYMKPDVILPFKWNYEDSW